MSKDKTILTEDVTSEKKVFREEDLQPGQIIPQGSIIIPRQKPSLDELGPVTPMLLLQQAVDKGVDIDKLTALMDLQERWEATEARKAYTKAMSKFKREQPEIDKNKAVDFDTGKGPVSYRHATLDNICNIVVPLLSKNFLSHKWVTKQENKVVSVTCTVTHVQGHSESVTLSADPDGTGYKNSIQAIGSTVTYLQRYTILAALGIAVKDQGDDDGAGGGGENLPQDVFNDYKDTLNTCQTLEQAKTVMNQISVACDEYNDLKSATALKAIYFEAVNIIKSAASEK